MKKYAVTLCERWGDSSCPEVSISNSQVSIGEDANIVKLKPEEWNILVDAIKTGKLDKVKV